MHAQNWIFGPPMRASGAMYALYLIVLTERNFVSEFHRENVSFTHETAISISEPLFVGVLRGNVCSSSLGRWKADSRLLTAELGRAPPVAKVTIQVNGRTEFSGSRPVKTAAGIKMKCYIIDYVGGRPHMQKLVTVGLLGHLPVWVTCTSSAFANYFCT